MDVTASVDAARSEVGPHLATFTRQVEDAVARELPRGVNKFLAALGKHVEALAAASTGVLERQTAPWTHEPEGARIRARYARDARLALAPVLAYSKGFVDGGSAGSAADLVAELVNTWAEPALFAWFDRVITDFEAAGIARRKETARSAAPSAAPPAPTLDLKTLLDRATALGIRIRNVPEKPSQRYLEKLAEQLDEREQKSAQPIALQIGRKEALLAFADDLKIKVKAVPDQPSEAWLDKMEEKLREVAERKGIPIPPGLGGPPIAPPPRSVAPSHPPASSPTPAPAPSRTPGSAAPRASLAEPSPAPASAPPRASLAEPAPASAPPRASLAEPAPAPAEEATPAPSPVEEAAPAPSPDAEASPHEASASEAPAPDDAQAAEQPWTPDPATDVHALGGLTGIEAVPDAKDVVESRIKRVEALLEKAAEYGLELGRVPTTPSDDWIRETEGRLEAAIQKRKEERKAERKKREAERQQRIQLVRSKAERLSVELGPFPPFPTDEWLARAEQRIQDALLGPAPSVSALAERGRTARLQDLLAKASAAGIDLGEVPPDPDDEWLDWAEAELEKDRPEDESALALISEGFDELTAHLIYEEGTVQEQSWRLDGEPVTVGRGRGNTVHVRDDAGISRQHFTMWAEGGRYFLRDEGSTKGTHVQGVRVEGEVELKGGEVILASDTQFVFRLR